MVYLLGKKQKNFADYMQPHVNTYVCLVTRLVLVPSMYRVADICHKLINTCNVGEKLRD